MTPASKLHLLFAPGEPAPEYGDPRYLENPPDDWEDCGCCGCWHPPDFAGDCRDDGNRWPFPDEAFPEVA